MHRSQRFGYCLYPLFLFFFFVGTGLLAQSSTSAPPSPPTGNAAGSPLPPPETQSSQPENPRADQIRLARQAQARIRARRQAIVRQTVEKTYSHKFEVYGGGGYQRFRPGAALQQINETAWDAGLTDYLWPRLGITADFRGYYGTAWVGNNPYGIFKPSISQYTFMAGPQYRLVRREHWALSAQALAGAAKGTFNGNSELFPGTLLGMWQNGTSFAGGAGLPVDFNLGPGAAFRLTPTYLYTGFGDDQQIKNLGFTATLVIRFGHR